MKSRGKRAPKRPSKRAPRSRQPVPRIQPRIGLEAAVERVVTPEWTIQHLNPDLPPVFSTPAMIGLMEYATVLAVVPDLPPGVITVGTRIEVDHLKAVAPGAPVRAWARLSAYQGRFLVFDVEAHSGEHLIGRGRVFRAIVDPEEHKIRAQSRIPQQC
ncbi:MAG: thioesterase [Acidobacteriota bacterium]|nr:thioesterase [Acidobacteriota bacterium]MDE3169649.1 thioesterase [Acidobacteriota bacterium]